MSLSSSKIQLIKHELRVHLPFTLLGTASSILLLVIIQLLFVRLGRLDPHATYEDSFHVFHFTHVFLSAIATTAIFYRHERNIVKAVGVGFLATLIFCGISDAILPFIGGKSLGLEVRFHLCIVEEPFFVLIANTIGIVVGVISEKRFGKITYFSHGAHVFVSSFASLFYLVAFGIQDWLPFVIALFAITTFAVVIPCCSSDIIMPLSLLSGVHGHEHEDEHTRKK